jgi:hypothetical protein
MTASESGKTAASAKPARFSRENQGAAVKVALCGVPTDNASSTMNSRQGQGTTLPAWSDR